MVQNTLYPSFLRINKSPPPTFHFLPLRIGKRNLPKITQDSNTTCAHGPLEIGMTRWWHLEVPEGKPQLLASTLISTPHDHPRWHATVRENCCEDCWLRTLSATPESEGSASDSAVRPKPQNQSQGHVHAETTGTWDTTGSLLRIDHLSTAGPKGERPSFSNVCKSKYSFIGPLTK